MQSIAKMKDELKRNFYVKELAEKYDVYEHLLFRELERALGQEQRTMRSGSPAVVASASRSLGSEKPAPGGSKTIPPEERDILKLILEGNADVIQFVLSNISLAQLSDERTKKLAQAILVLVQ